MPDPLGITVRRRLLLVRHAATDATRAAAFPRDDDSLDARSLTAAAALAPALPSRCEAMSSPAIRCRETVAAAGLDAATDAAIAECDFGAWSGRTLAEIDAEDHEGVAQWMCDPHAAPHGGETLAAFTGRVGRWLDGQALRDGPAVAITHAGVVKAAVVHALDAPIEAFWRIDVAPLAITELHAHDGRWTIMRINCPAGGLAS